MTVHERPVGATVEWYTPPSLFTALDLTFDLDPAASLLASWVPARQIIVKADDGLRGPWNGRVWLNPPYGPAGVRFVDRMIEHGNGMLLLPARTETRVFQRAAMAADTVCFLRDRLHFIRADGLQARSSFASVLMAFGTACSGALYDADLGWIVDGGGWNGVALLDPALSA